MNYKNNNFYIEKVKAENLIKKYGSPIYCYSNKRLVENIKKFILIDLTLSMIIAKL